MGCEQMDTGPLKKWKKKRERMRGHGGEKLGLSSPAGGLPGEPAPTEMDLHHGWLAPHCHSCGLFYLSHNDCALL